MFTLLKNAIGGKNAAFYDTFRVPHQQLLEAASQLPPPKNDVQLAFLQRLRAYIDGTCEFAHALFYGFNNGAIICTDSELRALGARNGQILFCMLLTGLIRYSLVLEREIGNQFYAVVCEIISPAIIPFVAPLSCALHVSEPQACEQPLFGIMQQFFPRIASDPTSRLLFLTYITAFAGVLNKHTLNALSVRGLSE